MRTHELLYVCRTKAGRRNVSEYKTGRKPLPEGVARKDGLHIRHTKAEKEALQTVAKEKGLTITELILTLIKQ